MGRREQVIAEARAEKASWLAGRYGWSEEQIAAYLAGIIWTGWLPPWWMWHRLDCSLGSDCPI